MKTKLTAQDWGMMIGKEVCYEEETGSNPIFTLTGVVEKDEMIDLWGYRSIYADHVCKPILRALDQMTNEEVDSLQFKFIHIGSVSNSNKNIVDNNFVSLLSNTSRKLDLVDWLTQKGFDIRNFIEQDLAIKYDGEKYEKV